ncbi:hypothetical protein F511_28952 [Dorcoceras hygrometricum]|uniref:Uncharacterized protein n=1 Tax=Dorcoceras hygrometricum TaxID=472368 RepID=A0A2Z7DAG9_9LAMI|nr:hypothetical protein F511_28952 [Dorcoceras hygrometricum]
MLIGIGPAVIQCAWSSHRNWLSVESSDSSDESESGSVGLLLLRRFVSYHFRRQRRSCKRITDTSPFSSGGSVLLGLPLWQYACARYNSEVKVFQDSQLDVALIQLGVPQVVDRVFQLAYSILCTSACLPGCRLDVGVEVEVSFRRSGGQNEDQRSFPSLRRDGRMEEEVDELVARMDSMELVMARFQLMTPHVFNGDESSEDADSWLQHIMGLFNRVQNDDELKLTKMKGLNEFVASCIALPRKYEE